MSSRPATPTSHTAPSTPQTGTWQHPKLDEIVRRQNASVFDKQNVKKILYNFIGIVFTYLSAQKVAESFTMLQYSEFNQYMRYFYYFIQMTLLYNIIYAFLPLLRHTDNLDDIPLTPAQRRLFGLKPLSASQTPSSGFNTPPKYARTSTPLSGSPVNLERIPGLSSGMDSPLGSLNGSSFSPIARSGAASNQRGPMSSSNSTQNYKNGHDQFATPTPAAKGGVGLNSKWLFDRGRKNSGTSRSYA